MNDTRLILLENRIYDLLDQLDKAKQEAAIEIIELIESGCYTDKGLVQLIKQKYKIKD